MQTRVSTKGQVVLPGTLRRKIGILPGDTLDIQIEGGAIILTPRPRAKPEFRIIEDTVTGLPVLSAVGTAPVLTTREVEEILAELP